MKVSVLKRIYHDQLGTLDAGRIVDLPDRMAERYLQAGAIQRYETKVIHNVPVVVIDDAPPLPIQPVKILKMPKLKDKKKGKA